MSVSPLQGIVVLDLSKVLAGPLCAQYLGDMGADVIKVESLAGDDTRAWPPFRDSADGSGRVGTVFLSANRNKRSVALDLKSPSSLEVIHRLARKADVVIESFGPSVADKLGFGAKVLMNLNPRLIYCNISGFGSVGPLNRGKGYDVTMQAFSGMLSITGERDGPAVRSPFSPVDQATGLHALIAVLAALQLRTSTGKGSLVEASLFDTATGFLGYFFQGFWEKGVEPQRVGSGHESLCPYQAFETATAPFILGVANDTLWNAFCDLSGLSEYKFDPQLATNADRVKNRAKTVAIVQEALLKKSREDWITALTAKGIPCSPINTLKEVDADPHLRESGMAFEYSHPSLGPIQSVAQPIRIDGERMPLNKPAPMHGQHTQEVLKELGYTDAEIKKIVEVQ